MITAPCCGPPALRAEGSAGWLLLRAAKQLPENAFGAAPSGIWSSSRAGALERLRHFVEHVLPRFGPHQDALLHSSWHMAHSLLSPYLNLGLLHPREVCDAAQAAYDKGAAPLASVEGFVRQATHAYVPCC